MYSSPIYIVTKSKYSFLIGKRLNLGDLINLSNSNISVTVRVDIPDSLIEMHYNRTCYDNLGSLK